MLLILKRKDILEYPERRNTMNNAMNLKGIQKEILKEKLILLISLTILVAVILIGLAVLLIGPDNDWSGLIPSGIMFVLFAPLMICCFSKVLGVDPSLKNLEHEKLMRLDEDILTAPRYENAILGRDYLLMKINRLVAIPYEDIVFVFGQNTTHSVNHVSVAKSSAIIVVDKNHKLYALNGRTKAFYGEKGVFSTLDDRIVLASLQKLAPWSFFGYSDENSKLYLQDFSKMVRMVQERKERLCS